DCATFFRQEALRLAAGETFYYHNGRGGAPNSGHLALIINFECELGVIRVANTHLKWGTGQYTPSGRTIRSPPDYGHIQKCMIRQALLFALTLDQAIRNMQARLEAIQELIGLLLSRVEFDELFTARMIRANHLPSLLLCQQNQLFGSYFVLKSR